MVSMPPAPDAGASLLGHYGLANPLVQWYLTHEPAILAYTPTELRAFSESYASTPRCRALVRTDPCGEPMRWRYEGQTGPPIWKCYRHEPPAVRHIRPKAPVMDAAGLAAEVEELIRRTLAGETLDLVYMPEAGGWVIVEG